MKIGRTLAALLVAAGTTIAKPPTTAPLAKTPTTQPAPLGQKPALQPAKTAARDIIEKFQSQRKKEQELAQVAYIDLNQPVTEQPPAFALFGDNSLTLHTVLDRLGAAKDDKDIRAVLINLGTTEFNLAQAQELRDALVQFRQAGKRSFIFSDAYDTPSYIAASGATDICMLEGGEIMIPGVGLETMFAKGLLDKVGVKADYIQIGDYKGADEEYTRSEPSKELRGELNKIVDSLFEQIVDGIAYNRNINRGDVQEIINNVFVSGKVAKERKLVDHLVDQDGLRDLIKKEMGRDINLQHDYGMGPKQQLDLSNPFAMLSSLTKKEPEEHKPSVALVYAEGVIVDGEAGDGLLSGGGQVGSEDLRKALRMASRDPDVKAIVLRIDSPGGSAMASEVMWQAARRAASTKPLIISVGSMAASGGYYLASSGNYIFADPSAIVGSIGVVGGKFVLKDLMEKVGVHTETFSRGNNAGLFSMNEPWSDSQRRLVTHWMQQTYEQFTARVLTTRKGKIKDIDEVAHGRIFLARQAQKLGMIDEIGGLEKALDYAAAKGKLNLEDYDVKVLPGTKTLGDILRGGPEARMPFQPKVEIGAESILRALSKTQARTLVRQIQFLQLMQQRPVVLVAPFSITTK
jgi:protease-4